jgi:hypothetical protein
MPKKTYRPEEIIVELSGKPYDCATTPRRVSDGDLFAASTGQSAQRWWRDCPSVTSGPPFGPIQTHAS